MFQVLQEMPAEATRVPDTTCCTPSIRSGRSYWLASSIALAHEHVALGWFARVAWLEAWKIPTIRKYDNLLATTVPSMADQDAVP